MKEYRIAFFTVDWNYELVESTLHGLKKYVDDHENVRLCIFDCFGKDIGNSADESEYAIFQLPDLSQFDGALIQGNQIVLQRARDMLAERIRAAGIPAVTIDCCMEGCTLVGIDNRRAQHDIADHVIRHHNARRLVYVTGILDNGCPEGEQRRDGFLDACAENGIRREDVLIIPGTWRTRDGQTIGEQWLREGKPLPDAFICANDDMALGMKEALQEQGVRIPQDVILTGIDNMASAELSNPRLSTVARDNARLNYFALDVLMRKIGGEALPDFLSFDYQILCTESCGCSDASTPSYIRDKYFHHVRFLKNFYNMQDKMAEELFEADTLPQLTEIVENDHGILGCRNVYLCINDYYFDNYEKKQWDGYALNFGEQMVLTVCGRTDIAPAGTDIVRFDTRDLLPQPLIRRERFLVFYPMHYNTYSIGYLVIDGISTAAKLNLHKSIFSFLEIAIENVRKKCLLRKFNDILDDLYVHDALTGLFNRFGYERFAHGRFDEFLAQDGGAQILFIDMDDMKNINDEYGHEYGDAAIRGAARILTDTCLPQDFIMRYGGDEFLVVASGREEDLNAAIQRAVERYNAEEGMPFALSLSVGLVRADAADQPVLDKCVQAADAMMYDRKNSHKAQTGKA